MKLHHSLLTVAVAFITGSNMFAADATESDQQEQTLAQEIDTSKPIEGSQILDSYFARLKNGKTLRCSKKDNIPFCFSHLLILDPKLESPQFFEILKKMHKEQHPLEKELFQLKDERIDREHEHQKWLNISLACNCPKDSSFTLLQKMMFQSWVHQCKKLDEHIKQSKDKLAYLDDQITDLKLKQEAILITNNKQ